jgi:hypothetical protein
MEKKRKVVNKSSMRVLVCQCRGVEFSLDKVTATAVSFRCAKCGLPTSVKGSVAEAAGDSVSVDTDHRTEPDPTKKSAPAEPKTAGNYRSFRFRISREQDDIIQKALEAVRIMNWSQEQFRRQDWQGSGLEFIAADFLGGVDHQILRVIEEAEEALERKKERFKALKGRDLTTRQEREYKARVRERLVKRYFGDVFVPTPRPEVVEPKPVEPDPSPPKNAVQDLGALLAAIKVGMERYAQHIKTPVEYLASSEFRPVQTAWSQRGGFLLKAYGDTRTANASNARPTAFVWMELDEDFREFAQKEYERGLVSVSKPRFSLVELIPETGADWDQPVAADARELI